jgi:hypothetical protein
MDSETKVLRGKKELTIAGESMEVRGLKFLEVLKFFGLTGEKFGKLLDRTESGGVRFVGELDKISGLIVATEELSVFVLQAATGKDKAWIDTLSLEDAITVIDACLELSFSEATLGKLKALGQRIGGMVPGAKATLSPQ